MMERIIERLVVAAALLLLAHFTAEDRTDLRVVQRYLAESPCE